MPSIILATGWGMSREMPHARDTKVMPTMQACAQVDRPIAVVDTGNASGLPYGFAVVPVKNSRGMPTGAAAGWATSGVVFGAATRLGASTLRFTQ